MATPISAAQTAPASNPAASTPKTAPKTAADISISDSFQLPRYSQMAMSPDGKLLATLAPIRGRENLAVIDLVKRSTTIITGFDDIDVADFM